MPSNSRGPLISQRFIVAIMGCLAFLNIYTLRTCIMITINLMVVPLNNTKEHSTDETCPAYNDRNLINETAVSTGGAFEWDEHTQGIIISSFSWGYILTQIPGGLLAEKYGRPKFVIGLPILVCSVLTVLTPVATEYASAAAMITFRLLMGLCQGMVLPAISSLLAKWIPPQERSFYCSIVYCGAMFGMIFSMSVSGLIMARFDNNWHFVFYFFGSVGILFVFFWVLLVSDTPENNRFISEKEKKYLQEHIKKHIHEKKPPFPWKHALTSKPFLAVILMYTGNGFSAMSIMSDLPKYFNNVLKLPIELNGYANSLPRFTSFIFCMVASWISDKLIEKKRASRTVVRKVNTAISCVGAGVLMISLIFAGCNVTLALTLVVVGSTLKGAINPGFYINILDLSPNYSGTLTGISDTVASVSGILGPYATGALTPNQTLSEWHIIFWTVFSIYFVCTVNFLVFASAEVQPWNDPEFLTKKCEKSDLKNNKDITICLDSKSQQAVCLGSK